MEPFTFASSSDLRLEVAVKVNRLEGYEKPLPYSTLLRRSDLRHRGSNLSYHSELYVTAQLYADSKPLGVSAQTPYKHFKSARVWNQWLTLPVEYRTLPCSTQLAITVWDFNPVNPEGGDQSHHAPFGGTTIPLFDEDAVLRTGRQKCRIWRHKAADGFSNTSTPWQKPRGRGERERQPETPAPDTRRSKREAELERLSGLLKKHEAGEIPEVKWLDFMVFQHIAQLERQSVRDSTQLASLQPSNAGADDSDVANGLFFLFIELPRFDHPVVFTDYEYPPPPIASLKPAATQTVGPVNFKPPPEVRLGPGIHADSRYESDGALLHIYDPEIGYGDNPAESKHRRLIRGQRNALDRDLKPNPKMRDYLHKVMSYGPMVELTDKEKDEVWRFRHHLTRDKRALTKLVKSVNWNETAESLQAISLLPKWAEIEIDDALELLGPAVSNATVRAYAVDRLRKADDEELLFYLLQLVQAVKFDPPRESSDNASDPSLASFLIVRSAANLKLGNFLYWYLMVELDENNIHPSDGNRKLYARLSYDFMRELDATPKGRERRTLLRRQAELVTILSKISRDVQQSRGDRLKKIKRLNTLLSDPKYGLKDFEPLPLPLDPDISITGIIIENCNVFKSSLSPLRLDFRRDNGEEYPLIFKTGDDLRQDQLVIQIIALMHRLLLKENLDLKLTPYHILATSLSDGAVQFVPSVPLSIILTTPKYKNSILGYLRYHNPPSENGASILGVRKDAMDTYVKSVAGYSVITYILGIGDRHSDNLLLSPDGHFFHIDFGYILGRDPKPMAPLMRLSREMVDGMGGAAATMHKESQFEAFRQYCFTAYMTLRRQSSLILNLLALMQDARIPGLAVFGTEAVHKVEERFKLEMSEAEAVTFFSRMVESEISSWSGQIIDRLHAFTQGWKA
ncbi:phosphatidylinositol 3-kinase [Piedraia hortae CBS 480.64]|uniref:Phosphatidylinositol 3-kinase VPS34 n=1 Tax=Piedraia hortae CBS 480.64 TaxID=1314780 RepID=A0A6A7C2U1_9PEZI|nr:phosphatidylinositol 3-kinase [Piedraia hortae CBS 480.64]